MKRWFIMIGAVIALVAAIGGTWGYNVSRQLAEYKETLANKKEVVTTTLASTQEWREQLSAVGSLRATRGADLATDVSGIVDSIHFESGADVNKGELLVELRAGDDIGKLESLRASAQLAKLSFERIRAQYDVRVVSKADFDTVEANLKSTEAQLAEQQAIVDKKRIRAPFTGHLGIRNVDPGQYVAAGTKIVTLQTLDPLYVDFSLPQQDLAHLRVGQQVTARTDTYPDLSFNGAITAVDPQVDTETRNVQVRATLQNPQRKLLPGMFVNLGIDLGRHNSYITLPLTAITYNPYGATAYIVVKRGADRQAGHATDEAQGADIETTRETIPDGKHAEGLVVRQVFVATGPTRGDQVAILKGITAGDEVVTSGQLKLKNNSPVLVNNAVQPTDDPDPRPQEK